MRLTLRVHKDDTEMIELITWGSITGSNITVWGLVHRDMISDLPGSIDECEDETMVVDITPVS